MPRSYQHISNYEKEILELKSKGLTLREIGARFGFTEKQVHNFITRYNEKQRKLKAVVALKAKGRPPKDCEITEDMKIAAARALAGIITDEELNEENIIPKAFHPGVADVLAKAVAAAWKE